MKQKSTQSALSWIAGTIAVAIVALMQPVRAETIVIDHTGEGQIVHNPDGTTTLSHTGTTTNETTGKVTNGQGSTTITKTSDGHDWTHEGTRTNSNGGSASTQTTGSAVNNGNGTGTWSSVTNASATSGKGKETDWTTDRNGSWQKTADGHTFQRESDKTVSNGTTVDRQTTGSVTRTGTGADISSTTTGERKTASGKESDWTTTRNEQVVNNGNGSESIDETITRTNSEGKTTTIDKTGEVTKEGPGKWEYEGSKTVTKGATASGTQTGPAANGAPTVASKSPAATPAAAAATSSTSATGLHSRMDEFKKSIESFHHNGRKAEERVALHKQFEDLRKHWDSNQQSATPELHRKWGEIRKSMDEVGHGRR